MVTDEEFQRLESGVIHLVRAMQLINQGLAEVAAHNSEHHEVLNAHAQALALLEELMIGGKPE
jgi:hypothetical protein